jgi:hypothetical protein
LNEIRLVAAQALARYPDQPNVQETLDSVVTRFLPT